MMCWTGWGGSGAWGLGRTATALQTPRRGGGEQVGKIKATYRCDRNEGPPQVVRHPPHATAEGRDPQVRRRAIKGTARARRAVHQATLFVGESA
jgi:hypothetical protein